MIEYVSRPGFVEHWKDGKLQHVAFDDGWKINFDSEMNVHCDNGPAVIKPNGTMLWISNDRVYDRKETI